MDTQTNQYNTNVSKEQFLKMLDYAKSNPTTPFAQNFGVALTRGDFNRFGSVELPPPQEKPKMGNPLSPVGFVKNAVDAAKFGFNEIVKPIVKDVARVGTNLVNAEQVARGKETTQPFSGKFLGDVKAVGADPNKTFGGNVLDSLGTGTELALAADVPGVKNLVKATAETLGKDLVRPAIEKTVSAVKPIITNVGERMTEKTLAKNLVKIQENIAPKITSKETQAAINEARLTRGKESILFGKAPDIVTASEEVQKAARVINETIPKAVKMTDVQLANAIDDQTTFMAKNLKGEMASTKIGDETLSKVDEAWNSIKTEQQADPAFLDNQAGNLAFQGKFENYLKEVSNSKTLDGIWDARIQYDASIPSNVKNATEASSPVLQARKAMWLQNRSIMNSAIHDAEVGLGDTSKKAFSDMSSLYEAKQNILRKAKIDIKGEAGFLPKNRKELAKRALQVGGSILGYEWIRKTFGH